MYKAFKIKFPKTNRSIYSLKSMATRVSKNNSRNGYVKQRYVNIDVYNFLKENSKNMTIEEIRQALQDKFGIIKERDVVHTYITNNKFPYKYEKVRLKNLDDVVLKYYNKFKKKYPTLKLSKINNMIREELETYYKQPIGRCTVQNVFYRLGLMPTPESLKRRNFTLN